MSDKGGSDRIVVVTGASRGAGKGIAVSLGATGSTVYITGRTKHEGIARLPGTIFQAAEEIEQVGGVGIPVVCDHADDKQVKALFKQIEEEHGHIDILVNNAAKISEGMVDHGPFWERPLALIDMLEVGARSTFVSSYYGAPLLLKSNAGLVVNTSSFGGGCYMHGPAFGAAKAAVDKMSHDMGIDFQSYNVCAISLWMGLLKTERAMQLFESDPDYWGKRAAEAESPKFVGRVIDALHKSPDRMERNGKVWISAELGRTYGVMEDDGSMPVSRRSILGGPWDYNPAVIG